MAVTIFRVLVAVAALWCFVAEATPVSVMHGDLCRRMNGRKYYLEADTHAIITATNVTLPAFPRIATQDSKGMGAYHRSNRRHRREGPQAIGLISDPRYRRNITSLSLSSLSTSNLVVPPKTSFVTPPVTTRIFTPLQTPSLEGKEEDKENTMTTPMPPLLIEEEDDEDEEDLESGNGVTTAITQPFKCGVEIITRPDCHLELTLEKVNVPSCSHDKSCRCDYLRLREPPYRGVGGLDICSMGDETPQSFTTQTKEVRMDFLYTRAYDDAFAVGITAKRNKYRVVGKVNSTSGYIRSPFFPELYPKEHWMEYDLVAKEDYGRVKVTFLDFQLSPWSFVEIQDTNKSRLAVFNGNLFRPPVLISSGPHITVRFSGNGETARGFNLQYAFIDERSNAMMPPITDCGGYVTNFGGTITMMNMSRFDTNYTMYDCVWIVQPPQNFAYKSHLSIKVVQFEEFASATSLEIRQGVTSDDYLLEKMESGQTKKSEEHVVAVDTGFYVRLRGFFSKNSKLAIVYSSFSYLGSCYSLTDLMCHNHRCIPKMLRCDGFDHCGDNSDEPASCYVGSGSSKGLTPEDAAWWYQHTPNYYFPQKSSFLGGQHGWSGVLLLTSLIILVIMMIGLISYMFKQGSERQMRDRRHGAHSRRGSMSDDVEVVDASADDPPLYEPPPDYEEVIKVILSGNNLKLVRRPGGLTAWVPDKLVDEGDNSDSHPKNDRPLRTRHASLDLEQGMEVVLWNSNTGATSRASNSIAAPSNENEASGTTNTLVPFRMGHIRRSSLPTAPTPETMHNGVQGHSVSVAPETIPEGPESLDSPRPPIRHMHTLSSPQISVRSFNYDTSAFSTPGPSTPLTLRSSSKIRKSKKTSKKGGKRKKSSAAKRSERLAEKDDSAPPSYEDAMQQVNQNEARSPTPVVDVHIGNDATNQVNESTQTSIDHGISAVEELSPTDRVHAARELFQKLSNVDKNIPESHSSQAIAKRPAVQSSKMKHRKNSGSGGTISRGTVKARKAMLLKSQKLKQDCDCNGACSCAHFNPESPSNETHCKGGVKSKVQYYLNIEESVKKRELETSMEQSPTQQESPVSNKQKAIPENTNSVLKKRKLVRNQSAPAISSSRDLDLDIYFSQREEESTSDMPSPSEDLERPLITPVTDSPRPIYITPLDASGKSEMSEKDGVSNIQKRVKLYNELAKPETPTPLSIRTPSPLQSPVEGINIGNILKSDSIESIEEESDGGIISMRSMRTLAHDASIKPGLVKEATAKFITTLATDIRPKLCQQDSDDWNAGDDSPLPVRIPYLNLKNELSSSPDICENNTLTLPPLKKEEAESIEIWDSVSQGRSENGDATSSGNLDISACIIPSQSSGAVPKKSASEVTIKLNKKSTFKPKKEEFIHNKLNQATTLHLEDVKEGKIAVLSKPVRGAMPSKGNEKATSGERQNHQTNKVIKPCFESVISKIDNQNIMLSQTIEPSSESERELKNILNLDLRDKFLPASKAKEVSPIDYRASKNKVSHNSKMVLEEVNLGSKIAGYQSSSDDDSFPPTPHRRQTVTDKLNETLETEFDFDIGPKITQVQEPVPPSIKSNSSQVHQEFSSKKFPIPSPRGSKAPQAKHSQNFSTLPPVQRDSSNENLCEVEAKLPNTPPSVSPKAPFSVSPRTPSPISPMMTSSGTSFTTPSPGSRTVSPSDIRPDITSTSSGRASGSSTPRNQRTPTLSPQMERSGIVTINTNKRLKWDFI